VSFLKEYSTPELEEITFTIEKEALNYIDNSMRDPKSKYWEQLQVAAGARLVILGRDYNHKDALVRIYRFIRLYAYNPPYLKQIMPNVIDHYKAKIKSDPSDVDMYIRTAMATNIYYGVKSRYPGARYIDAANSLKKDNDELCVECASVLTNSRAPWKPWTWNNDEKAMAHLTRAVSLNPENTYAYEDMSFIEQRKGNDKKALELMQKAFDCDPKNIIAASYMRVLLK
jgi:tetratricopeptide (TPR) repeat protein